MRLLHVSHQYRPAIGGSEQHLSDLSEALVTRGHAVDVATTRSVNIECWRDDLPSRESIDGVNVHRFSSLPRGWLGWQALKNGYRGRRHLGGALFDLPILLGIGPLAPGLARHIVKAGPTYDAIHIQTLPYAQVVYGYLCARLAGRPVVITPHLHVDQSDVFDLDMYNRVLRGADLVFADTEREVSYFTERGVKEERIITVGIGIKPRELPILDQSECRSRLGLPQDAFVVLFLGRKVEYKGIGTVLDSFARLQAAHPNLYFVSAGPPTDFSRSLKSRFAGLTRWVDLDMVEHSYKIDLLNACDVLALPSTGEAFGIVFLEAWSTMKPVIGARAGAIPWVIDDQGDGLLVESGDPTGLAAALETLMANPQLGRKLGAAGHQKVFRNFTVDRIADKVEAAYERVIAGRAIAGCARAARDS